MRCPECGTPHNNVRETREVADGTMLRRRRECFNGHRFHTYEVLGTLKKTIAKVAKTNAPAINKRAELWRKHQRVCSAVRSGKLVKDVASEFGLAESTVSWIIKQHMPDYNARKAARTIQQSRRT